jgi:hypothetical protein
MTRGFLRFLRGNTIALLALFIALGGTTYAATALPANSVGAKQLKKNAVINKKIKANAVTGAKVKNDSLTGADVNESTLGKVPSAANADHATSANSATTATNATNATNAATAANANLLNGIAANGLVRVARGNNSGNTALGVTNTTITTVSLTAPAAGFVLLTADVNTNGTGCPCEGWYLMRDAVSGTLSSNYKIVRNETSSVYHEGALTWIFPVTAGARTFQLQGFRNLGTTLNANGAALTALYVPFGSTGGATLGPLHSATSTTSTK